MKLKFVFITCALFLIFVSCADKEPAEIEITGIEINEPGETEAPGNAPESIPEDSHINEPPVFVEQGNPFTGVVINLTEAPEPEPFPWRNAAEMVAEMRIGWNLGNTCDAYRGGNLASDSIELEETLWGNPVTTRENIEAIRDAGFNVLRVPVTWHPRLVHGTEDFTIREDWMNRIIEIVDYGMDAGMFVILNSHHDEPLFSLSEEELEDSIFAVSRLWEQIGYVFRDYDHRLIFEGLNEPRTKGSRAEWNGGTEEERGVLNILNQVFVDTVREIGGNNINRALMIPTYAAAAIAPAINNLTIPNDPLNSENMLIVSLHMYQPYDFALALGSRARTVFSLDDEDDVNEVTWGLSLAYNAFVQNGIPVIMGEMGAQNRDNLEYRLAWADFYVSEAAARQIPCIWWDNGLFGVAGDPNNRDPDHFAIFDRRTNTFPFPALIDMLMSASE